MDTTTESPFARHSRQIGFALVVVIGLALATGAASLHSIRQARRAEADHLDQAVHWMAERDRYQNLLIRRAGRGPVGPFLFDGHRYASIEEWRRELDALIAYHQRRAAAYHRARHVPFTSVDPGSPPPSLARRASIEAYDDTASSNPR